jgi:hypothetical protein
MAAAAAIFVVATLRTAKVSKGLLFYQQLNRCQPLIFFSC